MKARTITKLRKRYTEKNWLKKQLLKWAYIQADLKHFKEFECSSFFRGETLASINLALYYKRNSKCSAKIKYYGRLLNIK